MGRGELGVQDVIQLYAAVTHVHTCMYMYVYSLGCSPGIISKPLRLLWISYSM